MQRSYLDKLNFFKFFFYKCKECSSMLKVGVKEVFDQAIRSVITPKAPESSNGISSFFKSIFN